MRHLKNNLRQCLCFLVTFAVVCGFFGSFAVRTIAADGTVLFRGSETEIRVDGAASVSGNEYTFSDTLTITLVSPENSGFERYELGYSSDSYLHGIVYYKVGSDDYQEDFFLEPGTDVTFSSLTDGYLGGQYGTMLSKIELEPINTNSAVFRLDRINTWMEDRHFDTMVYLENDRFKIGVHLVWGGGLSYLEDKQDGDDTVSNMLNCHDTGRLVQQSYYGTSAKPYVTAKFGESQWPYNPVQGGDQYGNKSKLVDFSIDKNSIYVKCRPLDWAQNNMYTLTYMENRYTITDEYVSVDNRFIDFSTYKHGGARDQELPAFYTISYLDTFTFYNGKTPWENGELTVKPDLEFWGGNSNAYFRMDRKNTETWCAWVSSETGYGIGLYTPNITTLLAGRFQFNGSKDAENNATNYVAPLIQDNMKNCEPFEYRYLITGGTAESIRALFQSKREVAENPWNEDDIIAEATPSPVPETEPPTAAPTNAPSSGGCGSMIGGSAALLVVLAAAGLILRKKESKIS